mgnify:CR=1 FL=1
MTIIDQIEKEQLRNDITPFNIGDTVRVMVKVKEGDKERTEEHYCRASGIDELRNKLHSLFVAPSYLSWRA